MVECFDIPIPSDEEEDDACDLIKESQFIVNEFKSLVNTISVSTKLPQNGHLIYFNCETKEGVKYCIELTGAGFRIVSNWFDSIDGADKQVVGAKVDQQTVKDANDNGDQRQIPNIFYETMNALLDKMSPLYRVAFSNQLIEKLNTCNP